MARPRVWFGVALIVFAFWAASSISWKSAFGQQGEKAKNNQAGISWEYKVLSETKGKAIDAANMEQDLNDLGKKGWELVGAVPEVYGLKNSTQTRVYLFLKRSVKQVEKR